MIFAAQATVAFLHEDLGLSDESKRFGKPLWRCALMSRQPDLYCSEMLIHI
jgi:hypothetical protein